MFLSWIPIFGPIIQGFFGFLNKRQDTIVEKYKVDGTVDVEAMKASANIIESTKDDIGIRLLRDIALTPPVIWSALIGWDTFIAKRYPEYMFHVPDYPASVSYIPYMAFVFLLGNIGLNAWKRR